MEVLVDKKIVKAARGAKKGRWVKMQFLNPTLADGFVVDTQTGTVAFMLFGVSGSVEVKYSGITEEDVEGMDD